MKPMVKVGLYLGFVVEVWTVIVIALGWHADMVMQAMFWLVIVIEGGFLFWGLRMTAKEGRSYGGQVVAGLVMSCVAGAIVFVGSYLIVTVIFPEYFTEVQTAGREALVASGMAETEIDAQMQAMASMQTPLMNSLSGALGTILTGLILSAIIGAFVKGSPAGSPSQPTQAA